jgi:hypothetical protein
VACARDKKSIEVTVQKPLPGIKRLAEVVGDIGQAA